MTCERKETLVGEFAVGQGVARFEDPRLLRGGGRYVDDIVLPRMAMGYVLRSPHAHARIRAHRHHARHCGARRAARIDGRGLEAFRMGGFAGPRRSEAPRRQPDVSFAVSRFGARPCALGRRLRRVRGCRNLCPGRRRGGTDRGGLRAVAQRHVDCRRHVSRRRRAYGKIARTTSVSFTSPATRRRQTRRSRARTTSSAIVSR